jgi:hypothetical protein
VAAPRIDLTPSFYPPAEVQSACDCLPRGRDHADAIRANPDTLLHVRYRHRDADLWVQSCDWATGVAHTVMVRRDGSAPTWGYLRLPELEPASRIGGWRRDLAAGPIRLAELW